MAMQGNVMIFAKGGEPPDDLESVARATLEILEEHDMLRSGAADKLEVTDGASSTFEDSLVGKALPDCVHVLVEPDQLDSGLEEIVDVIPEGGDLIELPFVEISVLERAVPILDHLDKTELGRTWVAIEFSYEDARLDEGSLRVKGFEQHPVFADLATAWETEVEWTVVPY